MNSQLRELLRSTYIEYTTPFRAVKNKLTFLYGHHLGVDSVDQNQLYDVLKKINKKTTFVDFDEACDLVVSNANINTSLACFSFDDGFEEVANNIVPVLKALNVNCCIFVNPAFIDASDQEREDFYTNRFHLCKKPSGWSALGDFVNSGGIVGSHTNNHYRLSELDESNARTEIVKSKQIIEEKLNVSCNYFAWPYGTARDITAKQLEVVEQHYRLSFSAIRSTSTFYRNKRTINRDHFEGNWRYSHLKYFLSLPKTASCQSG